MIRVRSGAFLLCLVQNGADDIVVCGGGIFPEEDIPKLKNAGIKEIFVPGTHLGEFVKCVEENVKPRGS